MAFLSPAALLPDNLTAKERERALAVLAKIHISIGRDLEWGALFCALEWPHKTALICDNHTWDALGKAVAEALSADGYHITLLNLGSSPRPDEQHVAYITSHAAGCDALIAAGSGTLNDLTQFAAQQLQKPYAICGTAPSMNGYLSANAAIIQHGHKKSLPAALPHAALFDLNVLEQAPKHLKQAGLGDSICRSTAQVDWLLSHLLLGTHYDTLPFALLAPYEENMLQGDDDALIRTLLLSGLGMTLMCGSYPASQAEHLLSHYMETRFHDAVGHRLHGEQIAVTTLYIAALQEKLLTRENAPQWTAELPDEAIIEAHFGTETATEVLREWHAKLGAIGGREAFNARIAEQWGALKAGYAASRVTTDAIASALTTAGAPMRFEDLGLNAAQWQECIRFAPFIRNRFTVLDLALLTGQSD